MNSQPLPIQTLDAIRRLKVKLATRDEELSEIRRLRYAVYIEEEGKVMECANPETRELGDANDDNAIHMYVADAGEVVACVRVHARHIPGGLAENLELERFAGCGQGHDAFISRLMVRKDHRGSMAAVRLMRAILAIAEGLDIEMVFCGTFPHLVSFYRRIGLVAYRAYQDHEFGPYHSLAARRQDLVFGSGKVSQMPQAA
jgi:predicted GNAT family N-acyltransferase